MATLEQRNGGYRVVFRFGGKRFSRSVKTRNEKQANASLARLEDNLSLVERGTLAIPDGADVATFLLSDGRIAAKPKPVTALTLDKLFDEYFKSIPPDGLEQSTIAGMQIHARHLKRLLGARLPLNEVNLDKLQSYVDQRAKEKGLRGRKVSAATIKKEITTLKAVWTWAGRAGHVKTALPHQGLKLPILTTKPDFQTWQQIDRQIRRGGLTAAEVADLWDALFLTPDEIEQVLQHVKHQARQPFLFPMVAFAAHTGARRSEMIRSRIDDINLEAHTAVVREKKRVPGQRTTRRVPLSPFLTGVLRDWLNVHPGGQYAFCLGINVPHSKTERLEYQPLTPDEAHDHLKRTLAGSSWEKLRGWHVFRHSFCSLCAARGVDQRLINAWVGHQTPEMMRRYQHLFPSDEQQAIELVFGNGKQSLIANP